MLFTRSLRKAAPFRQDVPKLNLPQMTELRTERLLLRRWRGSDREPFFSADGRRVYFLSDRDGFGCIWARDVDPLTGEPKGPAFHVMDFHHARQVIQGSTPYSGDIGLSSSRNLLVFAVAEYTSSIWLKLDSARGR